MLNKIVMLTIAAAFAALLIPSEVNAYGAAHVGYTHVGPNGVYHEGATVASGPGGAYAGGHVTAAGSGGAYGGEYRGGSYGGEHYGAAGAAGGAYGPAGTAAAGRVYSPTYAGGVGSADVHYAYVR